MNASDGNIYDLMLDVNLHGIMYVLEWKNLTYRESQAGSDWRRSQI